MLLKKAPMIFSYALWVALGEAIWLFGIIKPKIYLPTGIVDAYFLSLVSYAEIFV